MDKFLILFILLICRLSLISQNLVINPSFEELEYCETTDPAVEVTIDADNYWYSPTDATPNHLNACHTSGGIFWSVPENSQGFQEPHSGESYPGLITAQDSTGGIIGNYREYIQSELAYPLTAGVEYSIGFWCSLGEKSALASNNLGLHISEDAFGIVGSSFIELEAALESDTIFETENWVQIHGKYTAVGGEKFITLGNFNDFYNTDYAVLDSNAFFADAYYYIDDVYIIDSSEHVGVSDYRKLGKIRIYPNPTQESINVVSDYSAMILTLELHSIEGKKIWNEAGAGRQEISLDISNIPLGVYVLRITIGKESKHWKIKKI